MLVCLIVLVWMLNGLTGYGILDKLWHFDDIEVGFLVINILIGPIASLTAIIEFVINI